MEMNEASSLLLVEYITVCTSTSGWEMLQLFCEKIPEYPIVGVVFDLVVHLRDSLTQQVAHGEITTISIHLYALKNGEKELIDQYLEIGSSQLQIPEAGTLAVPLKITKTSLENQNRKYVIEVESNNSQIQSYTSSLIFVVTHRLLIVESIPEVWYKDHGGKGKWIKLHVQLVNEENCLIRSRNIPLKLSLHYSCGSLVPKQFLLKFTPTLPHIGETGELTIHFRIEEVSRSHQNKLFVVRVSPDIIQFPLNNDINPADTTPIRVMSKERPSQRSNAYSNDDVSHPDHKLIESKTSNLEPESSSLSLSSHSAQSSLPLVLNPHQTLSAMALGELIGVRDRIDVLLQSYYSLPKETIHSESDHNVAGKNMQSSEQEVDNPNDSEEEMYPNNSEEFNLVNLASTSEWGQYQRNDSNKRKRE